MAYKRQNKLLVCHFLNCHKADNIEGNTWIIVDRSYQLSDDVAY